MYTWGILGAGSIVSRWMRGARQSEQTEIRAIASRSRESAEVAAHDLQIPCATTYRAIIEDPQIDICYVAVPHPFHRALAEAAMNHGKHVLVEKPAAVTEADWRAMTECAKKNGVFLMEAMWTRLFPLMQELERLFLPEHLGPLKAVQCAFSYYLPATMADSRNLSPALAGGGLLDVGVYCLHLLDALFGQMPEQLTGVAAINTDENQFGVDEQAMILATYPGGRMANVACGVRTAMPDRAVLSTADAIIELPQFWKPTTMILSRCRGFSMDAETFSFPVPQKPGLPEDEGFRFEIEHTQSCIAQGLLESPKISWEATARVLRQCDLLRRQWGLVYPFEQQ